MTTKKVNHPPARLLYADSETSADMLYLGRFFVPDPFAAFIFKGKRYALLSALEIGRGKKESSFDIILSLEEIRAKAEKAFKVSQAGIEHCIQFLAKDLNIASFELHPNVPAWLMDRLNRLGVAMSVGSAPFFPESLIKTDEEAKAITKANDISAAGIRAAHLALEKAEIKAQKLYLDGKLLTSERVRGLIEIACLEAGGYGGCIVAGGNQACDPHCVGSGPLRANELIIVDVFPRDKQTGYYGDMTRTFLKGSANEVQKEFVSVVKEAHDLGIHAVKPGVKASTIHSTVADYFEERGCETGVERGKPYGFFHSTGHGLGLGLHEPLRIAANDTLIKKGMVFTIEPGLYYHGLGGCRIEDVVHVVDGGHKKLSSLHYAWEIK
jgi:Xaa-Pro aminopeptidase